MKRIPILTAVVALGCSSPPASSDRCDQGKIPGAVCDIQVADLPDVDFACPEDLVCEISGCRVEECRICTDTADLTCPAAVCDVVDVSCPFNACDITSDCPLSETDCGPPCLSACGDGKCLSGESADDCPEDCGPCGDGICGHHEAGPGGGSCPADCLAACGNGECEGGESPQFCLVDCSGCGDGFCGFMESPESCLGDCPPACGNGTCDPGEGVFQCAVDCFPPCGDALCSGGENPYNCPVDCTICGDGVCGSDESADSCAMDCVTPCGNGLCDGAESDISCPVDCGPCGDGVCGLAESLDSCPVDCHACAGKECGDDGFGGLCGLCDDGDACTTDSCEDFLCKHKIEPLQCDDANDCTDDSCDPESGCIYAALPGAPCDDGNPCTLGGSCADTICQGLAWNPCDDNNLCTDDSCEPPAGCLNDPNAEPCDDNDVCTTGDVCTDSACTGTGTLDCDDLAECTADSCDPVNGCQNDNVVDGTACGVVPGDICFAGSCCTPDCTGLNCGSDGCGGSCGNCPALNVCASGACFSTVCGGCSLDDQFDSWNDTVWEGNTWCNDLDQGPWEPVVADGIATIASGDECWSQIRTQATWGAYQGMRIFVTPNLASGGDGNDEAYIVWGNNWVGYAGNSAGMYLADGEIWTWRLNEGPVQKIGSYTAGEMVVLDINWHGTNISTRINGVGPYNVSLFELAGNSLRLIIAQKNSEDGLVLEAAIEP